MKQISRLLFGFLLLGSISSYAQSTDDIITNHIKAMGGEENLKSVTNIIASGNMNANGIKIPLTISTIQGKATRIEYTFNGMTGYQVITSNAGWNFSPFQGQTKPEPMTEDDVKKSQDGLDIQDDLINYKEKGYTIENYGIDEVEGTECFKLKVNQPSGKEKTYYIGKDDYMTIKVTEKSVVNGKEIQTNTLFSDYKKIGNGMQFAFNQFNDQQGEIIFDRVLTNTSIDERIFHPEKK